MTAPITARTRLAGVVGAPIDHSLSPILFGGWLAASQIDAVYLGLPVAPDRFEAFIDGLRQGPVIGLNVTAPFKKRALEAADGRSDFAKLCGASNLLLFREDGRVDADNTDGAGLLKALGSQRGPTWPASSPVVILGAGGAARAAAAALLQAGASEVRIVARAAAAAEALAAAMGDRARGYVWGRMPAAFADCGVVINATPLGRDGANDPDAPLEATPAHAVVLDMVYPPVRTAFLRRAACLGRTVVDGLQMLIGQAEPSFLAMFGVPPPPVDVRALALKALAARS